MVRAFKAKIRVLRSLTSPTPLIWLLNLSFKTRLLLCLMVHVLQLSITLIPPKIPRSENQSL
jgi:hypothetical protein